jgi:hypothetical protein
VRLVGHVEHLVQARQCENRRNDAVGPHDELPKLIPASRIVKLEGRDHMTAPSDPLFKDEVTKFFASAPP